MSAALVSPDTTKAVASGWPQDHMLEAAFGLICNVSEGDFTVQTGEWQAAARRWIDAYNAAVSGRIE